MNEDGRAAGSSSQDSLEGSRYDGQCFRAAGVMYQSDSVGST